MESSARPTKLTSVSTGQRLNRERPARVGLSARTPVEVARNVVESLVGEFEHENIQERDFEVADRLAVAWGRTALADRLALAKRSEVALHLSHGCAGADLHARSNALTVVGQLVDLGPDWLVLQTCSDTKRRQQVVISLGSVLAAQGLPEIAGQKQSRGQIWSRRKLTQLLRPLAEERQVVKIHADLGCLPSRILRVGADYVDLEVLEQRASNMGPLSLKFAAVHAIEAEL